MSADPRHLYVAGSGSDDDPGTEARPLATLHRARDFARELRSSAARRIEVVVRGGAYHLSEPLILTAQDSGSHAAPLRFSAYPGERVILSGGALLQLQWEPYRDGIVRAAVPAGSDFDQLFVANRRQMRARYPSFDPERPLMGEGGYVNAVGGSDEPGREELIFDPASFTTRHWPRPSEAVVHVFPSHYWHNAQYRITEIDWERSAIRLGEGGWQTHRFLAPNSFTGKSRFFVDNVFEELDTPGEWYLDSAANVLYYLPPPEIDLESAEVVAPRLERLVELRGSRHDPVRHVRFEGFSFTHTRATYLAPYEVPSTGDWGIHRGGAVLLEGAEDCTVLNSTFDAVGGNALFISNHARRIRIAGNTFVDTGDSAVCLCGRNNMVEAEWRCEYCGAGRPWSFVEGEDYPAECVVTDNHMHHIGVYGKQTAGVFMSVCRHNTVSHNHIHHLPRSGICINDPFWGGHLIEYNDVHETVLESDDHGSFNAWGRGHYWCLDLNAIKTSHLAGDVKRDARYQTIVRYNRFSDRSSGGLTLDDGASNFHVYCNLFIGTGLQTREGEYRIVENNVFINPSQGIGYDVLHEQNHDQFLRNVVVLNAPYGHAADSEGDTSYKEANVSGEGRWIYRMRYPPSRGKWVDQIDYNTLFDFANGFPPVNFVPRTPGAPHPCRSWDEWHRLGFDRHSVLADPLFVDPGNGDYRVRPESPALALGFRNFDVTRAGCR